MPGPRPSTHLIKNQKGQAHGYRTWEGFRAQIIWCYGEVIDPETGEILPLRSLPRGTGATWLQPQFAQTHFQEQPQEAGSCTQSWTVP